MPRTLPVPDVVSSRPVRVALAVILTLGLFGGCSFGGSAPVATSTSAVPTVAASPTPTPAASPSPTTTTKPERPAAMDTVDLDGAIATAEYFLSLYPYVYNTGDLTDWKALAHSDCIFCASVVTNAERMHGQHQHQVGTDTVVNFATGVEVDPGAWFSVDINATQGPWSVIDDAGTLIDAGLDTKSYLMHLVVVREENTWRVRAVQVDSP
ncbi:hypothetical protein DDP54_11950 [Cellulomonas sp. WB94]|uniref:DUF6318 family protein n=1 Tax=Cellulomonas sp. WB94 TaxID=2173174 RepID=UPI000D586347|nr:DUF6318 family protein [Cellulomonas sp. WB94]PVU83588.1 hypothetical protein DDP54_11950 [Cellulomonas sp. WB94]